MKRIIFTLMCLIVSIPAIRAQDTIMMSDGSKIYAKLIGIEETNVRYKPVSNLSGPDRLTAKANVIMIRCENGNRYLFEKINGVLRVRLIQSQRAIEQARRDSLQRIEQENLQRENLRLARLERLKQDSIRRADSIENARIKLIESKPESEKDIIDLIAEKRVEVEIAGDDITNVRLRVKKLSQGSLTVKIPVGAYFVSANSSAQNMVATEGRTLTLSGSGWQSVNIPAACANRPKDIPDSNDSFTVQRSPNQEELTKLMPVLNRAGVGTTTRQAAVWIITDNADYDDLGILVSGNQFSRQRVIGAHETARAMQICDRAEIDITKKNIWRDRQTILNSLSAGELKNWLAGKIKAAQ